MPSYSTLLATLAAALSLLTLHSVVAHDNHEQQTPIVPEDADWATRHMAEEHHIQGFDAATFFTLHAFTLPRTWTASDIQRMYGLYDSSNAHVSKEARMRAVLHVYSLFAGWSTHSQTSPSPTTFAPEHPTSAPSDGAAANNAASNGAADDSTNGTTDMSELALSEPDFVAGWEAGIRLPDMGFGPGHHGDDEWEYEIHHWERWHGGVDEEGGVAGEEELVHEEDREHFRKHDEDARREKEWEELIEKGIVERNIPGKFLKGQ